jgi:hypothetical protein
MKEILYVVLSRDTDFIYCTFDKQKANLAKKEQIEEEEMSGGRPSVHIKETTID